MYGISSDPGFAALDASHLGLADSVQSRQLTLAEWPSSDCGYVGFGQSRVKSKVLGASDGHEVFRIDAGLDLAEVVEFSSFWNRTIAFDPEANVHCTAMLDGVVGRLGRPSPDPACGVPSSVFDLVTDSKLPPVVAIDESKWHAFGLAAFGLRPFREWGRLTTSAFTQAARLWHSVASVVEVAVRGTSRMSLDVPYLREAC